MPDRPILFVDRCLGRTVGNALRAAGANVRHHDDHFAQNSDDENWIATVSEQNWLILTKDKNIRRPSGQREAVLLANAKVVTLSSGNMKGSDMAALFVTHLAEIEELATKHPPPLIAVLSPIGLEILFPRATDSDTSSPEAEPEGNSQSD